MLKSIKHYIEMQKWRMFVFSLLAVLWCAATWFVFENSAHNRVHEYIDREHIQAKDDAESIASNIGQRIFQVRSIPSILAVDYYVVSALIKVWSDVEIYPQQLVEKKRRWLYDPMLDDLSNRLNKMRTEVSLHTLFVLNANGDCIAAGKPQEFPVFIGVNYSDRKYFLEAQEGDDGRQFAIGRTDSIKALFYSKPVLDSGKFIGAIVSRVNVESLTNLVFDQDVFVTDENGVVILAKDSNLLMKALPGSRCLELSPDMADNVYKTSAFDGLDLVPLQFDGINGVVRWKDSEFPYVHTSVAVKGEKITVHVLRNLKQVKTIMNDRILLFGAVSFSGTIFMALILGIIEYIRSISNHRNELISLNNSLNVLARTDALTGCANRRHFYEVLESERKRGVRYGSSFSLLGLDIDHFKQINDAYGHPAGDRVLCGLVSIVKDAIRPNDKVGRVGGEEFSILLVETTESDAVAIAERIRCTIQNARVKFDDIEIYFTVSVGVSQWKSSASESLDSLISRCDKALYQAKGMGRNQIVVL